MMSPAVEHLDTATVAQTSKSAVSRVSKPAGRAFSSTLPTWESAIQQVWKPALRAGTSRRMVAGSRCAPGGWSSRHCLGNEDFVWIWALAGASELVKRVGAFVKSLVSAVKVL